MEIYLNEGANWLSISTEWLNPHTYIYLPRVWLVQFRINQIENYKK